MGQRAFPLPDKPSIAVLPFKIIISNEIDDLIANGLTEDIITALSRVGEIFVIASATSSTYQDETLKVSQVSEELGIRYILDGNRWENDWEADSYIRNPFGTDDSLVKV